MPTNLEYYRKAAKSLLKAAQAGDAEAIARIARHSDQPLALSRAQLAIAREQGFQSWPRFRAFLAEFALDFQALVQEFTSAALDNLERAEDMLARHPELLRAGFYVALLLGDASRVEDVLAAAPAMAVAKGGPRNWPPLAYVCFSEFAAPRSSRENDLLATARLLLARGADPNAFIEPPEYPGAKLSCLYAASGGHNNLELARLLLDAGAQPDDGESLYHATEHGDLECVRLLLQHGAAIHPNTLKHMLDQEHLEGVRLLLAAGADPNATNGRGDTSLHWAVMRGRGLEIIGALLDAGAGIDARREDGRTAYGMAVQSGQTQTAELLAARGASTEMLPLDRFIGACAAAGPDDFAALRSAAPEIPLPADYHHFLPDFAANRQTAAVRALLALGVPVDARGENGGTALHWACWKGYADLVALLLDHGASLTIEDEQFHGTPPGWFGHGLRNCREGRGDYPAVARLLLQAGAAIEEGG